MIIPDPVPRKTFWIWIRNPGIVDNRIKIYAKVGRKICTTSGKIIGKIFNRYTAHRSGPVFVNTLEERSEVSVQFPGVRGIQPLTTGATGSTNR